MIPAVLLLVAMITAICFFGYLWIAMAFGLGESLSREVHGQEPLTWREVLTMSYMD